MRTFDNELRKCLQRVASSGDVAILQVWLQKFLLAGFRPTRHPPWNETLRVTYFPQNALRLLSAAWPRSLRLRAANPSEICGASLKDFHSMSAGAATTQGRCTRISLSLRSVIVSLLSSASKTRNL